jgi:hypothetical protein
MNGMRRAPRIVRLRWLACLLGLAYARAVQGGSDYCWPLDLPPAVTSSFAEYREGRFHTGIDLRTGGIGKPVHVAGDGYVSRVRCSPWGYGKAVYVRLSDGNTAVYAHLNAFFEPLAEFARAAQHAGKSYTVDLYPGAEAFPVTRGQVIAESGQTGIGVPHLHYEVRDAAERVINPRSLGIRWPDTVSPVIRKAAIIPADPDSSVNGDIVPLVREVRLAGPGEYRCDPVCVRGRVGFAVDVIDPANDGDNQLGVYSVSTEVNGTEVFRVQNDRLSYDTNHNGAVAFHPFLLDKGPFLLQWRWPGNRCEPFQQSPSDGWVTAPEKLVEVRITATDFLGNAASLGFSLKPDAPLPAEPPGRAQGFRAAGHAGTGRGKVSLDCAGNWVVITVRFREPEATVPELVVEGPAPLASGVFFRVDAKTFRAGYMPPGNVSEIVLQVKHERIPGDKVRLHVFHRGDAQRAEELEAGVRITAYPESPYGLLMVRGYESDEKVSSPIRVLGKAYHLWPDSAPIATPVELRFPLPEGAEQADRVHVYRKRKPGWSAEETRRIEGALTISTRELGTFAVMEDDKPPRIADVVPTEGASVGSVRPEIRATVSDQGSGIAEVTATCNGQWLLMAYDPEGDRVTWERDEDLPSGPKEIVFTAIDRAGNTTTCSRTIAGP